MSRSDSRNRIRPSIAIVITAKMRYAFSALPTDNLDLSDFLGAYLV